MPLYADMYHNYLGSTSPSSSSAYTSYSSPSQYTPYTNYSRGLSSSYSLPLSNYSPSISSTRSNYGRGYLPKLTTISETPLSSTRIAALTRISSPKTLIHHSSPKYIAPRPIRINTSDIDVSAQKYRKYERQNSSEHRSDGSDINNNETTATSSSDDLPPYQSHSGKGDTSMRSTIKRDRAVVRLSTLRARSKSSSRGSEKSKKSPEKSPRESYYNNATDGTPPESPKTSWRQNFGEELSLRPKKEKCEKTPGEILREKHLIREEARRSKLQASDNSVFHLESLSSRKSTRRKSLPKLPSFHDFCKDISSDKLDDDLNAGELRKRASLIIEEELQTVANKVRKSSSGTLFCLLERQLDTTMEEENSDDTEESGVDTRRKSKKIKKIKHKITAKVDIDEPAPRSPDLKLKAVIDEVNEISIINCAKPKINVVVEAVEEDHTTNKVFKLPKKKKKTYTRTDSKVKPEVIVTKLPTADAKVNEKKVEENHIPLQLESEKQTDNVIPKHPVQESVPPALKLEESVTPAVKVKSSALTTAKMEDTSPPPIKLKKIVKDVKGKTAQIKTEKEKVIASEPIFTFPNKDVSMTKPANVEAVTIDYAKIGQNGMSVSVVKETDGSTVATGMNNATASSTAVDEVPKNTKTAIVADEKPLLNGNPDGMKNIEMKKPIERKIEKVQMKNIKKVENSKDCNLNGNVEKTQSAEKVENVTKTRVSEIKNTPSIDSVKAQSVDAVPQLPKISAKKPRPVGIIEVDDTPVLLQTTKMDNTRKEKEDSASMDDFWSKFDSRETVHFKRRKETIEKNPLVYHPTSQMVPDSFYNQKLTAQIDDKKLDSPLHLNREKLSTSKAKEVIRTKVETPKPLTALKETEVKTLETLKTKAVVEKPVKKELEKVILKKDDNDIRKLQIKVMQTPQVAVSTMNEVKKDLAKDESKAQLAPKVEEIPSVPFNKELKKSTSAPIAEKKSEEKVNDLQKVSSDKSLEGTVKKDASDKKAAPIKKKVVDDTKVGNKSAIIIPKLAKAVKPLEVKVIEKPADPEVIKMQPIAIEPVPVTAVRIKEEATVAAKPQTDTTTAKDEKSYDNKKNALTSIVTAENKLNRDISVQTKLESQTKDVSKVKDGAKNLINTTAVVLPTKISSASPTVHPPNEENVTKSMNSKTICDKIEVIDKNNVKPKLKKKVAIQTQSPPSPPQPSTAEIVKNAEKIENIIVKSNVVEENVIKIPQTVLASEEISTAKLKINSGPAAKSPEIKNQQTVNTTASDVANDVTTATAPAVDQDQVQRNKAKSAPKKDKSKAIITPNQLLYEKGLAAADKTLSLRDRIALKNAIEQEAKANATAKVTSPSSPERDGNRAIQTDYKPNAIKPCDSIINNKAIEEQNGVDHEHQNNDRDGDDNEKVHTNIGNLTKFPTFTDLNNLLSLDDPDTTRSPPPAQTPPALTNKSIGVIKNSDYDNRTQSNSVNPLKTSEDTRTGAAIAINNNNNSKGNNNRNNDTDTGSSESETESESESEYNSEDENWSDDMANDKIKTKKFDPTKKVKLNFEQMRKCYAKEEKSPIILVARPRPLWKINRRYHKKHSDSETSEDDDGDSSDTTNSSVKTKSSGGSSDYSDIYSDLTTPLSPNKDENNNNTGGGTSGSSSGKDGRLSTSSQDSGFFGGTAPISPKKMLGKTYHFPFVLKAI